MFDLLQSYLLEASARNTKYILEEKNSLQKYLKIALRHPPTPNTNNFGCLGGGGCDEAITNGLRAVN